MLPDEHDFRSHHANYFNLHSIVTRIPHPEGGVVLDKLTDILSAVD